MLQKEPEETNFKKLSPKIKFWTDLLKNPKQFMNKLYDIPV